MVVIIGFIASLTAIAVIANGYFANGGSSHALGDFGIFGQHPNNLSTGTLFFYGALVGIIGMLGLILLWGAFTRRIASGGMRRELENTKHESEILRKERDRLNQELEIERKSHHILSPVTPAEAAPSSF